MSNTFDELKDALILVHVGIPVEIKITKAYKRDWIGTYLVHPLDENFTFSNFYEECIVTKCVLLGLQKKGYEEYGPYIFQNCNNPDHPVEIIEFEFV